MQVSTRSSLPDLLAANRKVLPEGDPRIGGAMSRLGECLGAAEKVTPFAPREGHGTARIMSKHQSGWQAE